VSERHEVVLAPHPAIDVPGVGSVLSMLIDGKDFVATVLASHGPDVNGKVHLVITPPAGPEPL
jgi:hypothetical protein